MTKRSAAAEGERGFALLLVFLLAAAIAISLYMEMPRVAFETQRNREQLLVDRGHQYQRAIQLFVRANKRYPSKIEDLESFNDKRYLRHRFIDPFTGKDDWRMVHVAPNGMLTDSLVPKNKNPLGGPDDKNKDQQASSTDPNSGSGTDPNTGGSFNLAKTQRPSDRMAAQLPAMGSSGVQPTDSQQQETPSQYPGQPGQAQYPGQYPGQQFPPPQYPGQVANPGAGVPQNPGQPYIPGQPLPGQPGGQPFPTQAGQQFPGQTGQPGQPVPGQPFPGQPGQTFPGQPGQQFPGQPGQQFPTQTGPQFPQTGQPMIPGQTVPFPGQPIYPGQQQTGQPGMPPQPQYPGMPPQQPQYNQGSQFPSTPGASPNAAQPNPALSAIGQQIYGGSSRSAFNNPQQGAGMGTGIAGVGVPAEIKGEGIMVIKDRTKYREWEFIYDPKEDKTIVGAAGVQQQQQMQQPAPGAPPAQPSQPSQPPPQQP